MMRRHWEYRCWDPFAVMIVVGVVVVVGAVPAYLIQHWDWIRNRRKYGLSWLEAIL